MNTKLSLLAILVLLSLTQFALASDISAILSEAEAKGAFSGSLLIAKNDKIIFKGSKGLADRSWGIPNSADSRYRISSVTKQFTTMLVMQLVEEGKVKLDAPVTEFLKNVRTDTFSRVTIRNLLQSSSGLPDLADPLFYKNQDPKLSDADTVIGDYLGGELQFEPGSKFNYNNGDFIVVGAIIEKVTGKSFETVLSEKILKPLEMSNTGVIKLGSVISKLPQGYVYKDGVYKNEAFRNIQNYGAAGAMYSTVGDMHKWNRALMQNKLLNAGRTLEMFTPSKQLGYAALGSWAYTFKTDDGAVTVIERQGAIGGFSSLNLIVPEQQLSLIFLCNVETLALFQTYTGQGLSARLLKIAISN